MVCHKCLKDVADVCGLCKGTLNKGSNDEYVYCFTDKHYCDICVKSALTLNTLNIEPYVIQEVEA